MRTHGISAINLYHHRGPNASLFGADDRVQVTQHHIAASDGHH